MALDDLRSQLPDGEIVLVETRQHWVAALRFALKPILLIGLVVLLALLNQWLDLGDSVLAFLNTIIHFILVIMIIVAVVWLPVDLVQWYSRRYVLTNRRAIRASGVLRKQTAGSSLEKINDIGLNQTLVGRLLGYANLTLYTASDSANESFGQLIDALQFKKAVLEAKEGLRRGRPLQALPDGMVVRGGTNEASMRADGTAADAASDETAGDADGGDSGPPGQPAADDAPPPPAHASPLPEPVGPITAEPVTEPSLAVAADETGETDEATTTQAEGSKPDAESSAEDEKPG